MRKTLRMFLCGALLVAALFSFSAFTQMPPLKAPALPAMGMKAAFFVWGGARGGKCLENGCS